MAIRKSTTVSGVLIASLFLVLAVPILAQAPASQPADAPKIEAGSAKAGLRDFLAAARAGSSDKVAKLWQCDTPDETEFSKSGTELIVAMAKLDQKEISKFGDAAQKSTGPHLPDDAAIAAGKETVADGIDRIESADPDKFWNFPMIKTNDGWKVSMAGTLKDSGGQSRDALKKMLSAMDKAATDISADIDSGKIKSVEDADAAFGDAVTKAAMDTAPTTQKN